MVFGVLIGAFMTAAFVYISLKLGFGMPGSTVAAILGFAVLRGVLKKGSIIENNINQTVASAVNNASSGVSFTLPALFILGLEDPELLEFDVLPFIMAAVAGTFMGIVIIIPLRKQMIEFERLRFPSGIAVATLLKSPGAGARQAMLMLGGFGVAAFLTALAVTGVIPEELSLNHVIDDIPEYIPIAAGVSFASLGAGLLSGKGGLPFVFGGILAWWVIAPISVAAGWAPDVALANQDGAQAHLIFLTMLRPLGIGMLIGGALAGVVASFPALKSAMRSLGTASRAANKANEGPSDELPGKFLYIGLGGAVMVLFTAAMIVTSDVSVVEALAMAVVGTLWLALAGLIVAQATGMTDISPLSGMALIAVTIIFFISSQNIVAAILLGVAICVGIGQCADMMSDLKAGHLIGAIPSRQQYAQFLVAWMGVPVAIGVLFLLWSTGPGGEGGFGPLNPDLSAPQGEALASIIRSLGSGDVAIEKYIAGAGIGAALSAYPIGGMGVLVGLAMYLPFYITVTYGIGCVIAMILKKTQGSQWIGSTLVPVAAGFIIGEAITQLVNAMTQI
jgi:putative OPT family oligopeptide transporter